MLVGDSCVAESPDATGGNADAGGDREVSAPDARTSDGDAAPIDDADATALVADPCPAALSLTCDPACDPGFMTTYYCSRTTCGAGLTGNMDVSLLTFAAPAELRTPNMPPQDPDCSANCNPNSPSVQPMVFGMTFGVNAPTDVANVIEVRVGSPWWIDDIVTQGSVCAWNPPENGRAQGCLAGGPGQAWAFLVWTKDADAVARNIQVAEVSASTACQ